ncbi:short-chain dehydrogenase [Gymnopilus junonius]|uniref:Short-chain dehydrogenase n=1 Tax=Gymnopilus junonius TaxID=109634 RepID=A0A9P5NTQ3_GYMJU|nr:short-chain dehydrogenase [Gymnopilus junonius]
MKLRISQFINQQLAPVSPVVEAGLQGKTVIIIGANNGIGYEAAKHFALMKPGKLVLACRSKERGDEALNKLKDKTGCDVAELWILDLASFDSVKSFAKRFEKDGGRLDILVENAGILPDSKCGLTDDGWEPSFQVNHLSTSLLALLLLPRMIQTAVEHHTRPRLVIVSSDVHYWAKISEQVLTAPEPLKFTAQSRPHYLFCIRAQNARYSETKLMNVFFVRALNERLQTTYLIVNAVNPGYCHSHLRAGFSWYKGWADWALEKALAHTAEEGSRSLVWAAVGGKEQEDHLRGAYISMAKITEASDYVIGEEGRGVQELLWNKLITELSKVDPRVWQVVRKYLTPAKDPKEELVSPLTLSYFTNI